MFGQETGFPGVLHENPLTGPPQHRARFECAVLVWIGTESLAQASKRWANLEGCRLDHVSNNADVVAGFLHVACSSQSQSDKAHERLDEGSASKTSKPPPSGSRSMIAISAAEFNLNVTSAWGSSNDGAVSVRMVAPSAVSSGHDVIYVTAELRNNTRAPLVLKRPFADIDTTASADIELSGPSGRVRCLVSKSSVHLVRGRFEVVPPGESIGNRLAV